LAAEQVGGAIFKPERKTTLKLAFALLAHGNPHDVARLIRTLVDEGHQVALHYDLGAAPAAFERIRQAFVGESAVRFARRVRVRWGQWGVVQGTLNCLAEIADAGWEPDYVYHISGMDYPIRPSHQLVGFLERNRGDEFIEAVPADREQWVKTGPQRERYLYRWWFNWRDQPQLTELAFAAQKILGLERPFVYGMRPHIGSQWWVLTWKTLQRVLALAAVPELRRFFRTTLVPDELFFQTLVRHVADPRRIVSCPLTLYQFTDYGCPVVYEADHLAYLLRQRFFFARKISPHDTGLRDQLDTYWRGDRPVTAFADEDVGLLSREYEDHRLTWRDGPPGRPVPGRSQGGWHGEQKRLAVPYFVVIGTSSAELRLLHRCLARHHGLRVHGQLFHPSRIEFAEAAAAFAGYAATALRLRDISAPCFLADVVRAEPQRLSGFMLRWGQGWHLPELVMERPQVRVLLLQGCPLLAFAENLLGQPPLLDQKPHAEALAELPPAVAALRFRRFLPDYKQHLDWLEHHFQRGRAAKPEGWMARISAAGEDGWLRAVAGCLGVEMTGEVMGAAVAEAESAVQSFADLRAAAVDLLRRGGIDDVPVGLLRHDPPQIGLAATLI
jgi:hypothetical protein